jgi:bifunctional ADP-heptose synthase (sugar kinase/adenylyltransferase)
VAAGTDELSEAAHLLCKAIAPSALLVTRGEQGMSLFEANDTVTHLPARVNEVADVTGAGDTVVAVLAVALGMGFSLRDAAELANTAAGIAVSHHGTWAVKGEEMLAGLAQGAK